jgi:hypothetical protein
MLDATTPAYPVNLSVDYSAKLDRLSSAFRIIAIIPIAIILSLLSSGLGPVHPVVTEHDGSSAHGASIAGGLFVATALMIVVRRRYPRWWFDFANNLVKLSARVMAYATLLTDRYPATEDEQGVHLELLYPDATKLNRWLPLVKWLLAIPHYVALCFLGLGAVVAVAIAWFAILFTGVYPKWLFDYVVGVGRWALRVQAYAFLLITDEYPPFRLAA